jgi:hypothetical protein
MGVIDKICVKLSCDKCGTEENMTALDTGSGRAEGTLVAFVAY